VESALAAQYKKGRDWMDGRKHLVSMRRSC